MHVFVVSDVAVIVTEKKTRSRAPQILRLRTSASSPSRDFEALDIALLVLADVLVFVEAFVLGKKRSGMKTEISGRERGISRSRTARTSTSCGGPSWSRVGGTKVVLISFKRLQLGSKEGPGASKNNDHS